MTSTPVLLGAHDDASRGQLAGLVAEAHSSAGDVTAALALAAELGDQLPMPGDGRTAHLWSALASVGAADLTVARVLEPHLDALAILRQADVPAGEGTWGVFAAEGPGEPLRAAPTGSAYRLIGRKHWCSLAARLDRALVSAWVGEQRQLFAVDLRDSGVSAVPGTWVARGLSAVDSGPVDFADVPARPIGEPGWYLERPGFAWGGLGVAAIWYGGAVGVARRLLASTSTRSPDQVAWMHLGAVDAALHGARCVLEDAAAALDSGELHRPLRVPGRAAGPAGRRARGRRSPAARGPRSRTRTARDRRGPRTQGVGPGPLPAPVARGTGPGRARSAGGRSTVSSLVTTPSPSYPQSLQANCGY